MAERRLGGMLFTERESNDIYKGSSQLPWSSRFIDIDGRCYDDPERRTWRRPLGDLSPKLTLAVDPHALLVKADATAALKQASVDFGPQRRKSAASGNNSAPGHATEDGGDDDAALGGARILPTRASRPRSGGSPSRTFSPRSSPRSSPRQKPDRRTMRKLARLIFHAMSGSGFHDAVSDTVKRRRLERPKGELPVVTLRRHADSLDAKGLRSLILELALARGAYFAWSTTYSEDLSAAASAYGVDIDAIAKSTARELESRRAERAQKRQRPTAAEAAPPDR